MRNLLILSDYAHTVVSEDGVEKLKNVCLTVDLSREHILLLTAKGLIQRFPTDFFAETELSSLECTVELQVDNEWFSIEYIDEICSLVCVSHSGSICRMDETTCEQVSVSCIANAVVTIHL